VIPVACIRDDDGELTARFYPAVSLQRTGDFRSDIQLNTQLMTDAVEAAVRDYPEQWGWYQRKWKKHYPELYHEFFARKARKARQATRAHSA
jgi:lauroyl/myristoyl acyltransferase